METVKEELSHQNGLAVMDIKEMTYNINILSINFLYLFKLTKKNK